MSYFAPQQEPGKHPPLIRMVFRNAALLLALTACEKNPTNSENPHHGQVNFSYQGTHSGSFRAKGAWSPATRNSVPYAVGGVDSARTFIAIYGYVQRSTGRGDAFGINAPARPGTVECDDGECAFFFLNSLQNSSSDHEAFYQSVTGTINVTDVTDTRARGNFCLQMQDPGY